MRRFNARLIAPILRRTGFRFDKHYRWGTTLGHRIVYSLVSTIEANIIADGNAWAIECND
jgi:hypothetical protein